ncbi:UDP-glucose/GDP-mannose dehydrogenase [Fictibacillus macauensis ZFHKF-1]|uniref:UDP-glucose/GDP-mannose dehydrogenase n=1 Tax=Fictibacillus macauensis ZFHKF-1 TaxID=1196324 RepID=I8UJA6_9BACL|nr:nucleotide sugar dehydrogenase [Fictibacillus macauensis]EIT86923.1 UDP-glucose/GDP-mannose dehydrogenase [Fictibacillus macauensis ZFHKF-1]
MDIAQVTESITTAKLLAKIHNKTAKIGVVGLGYVGLPLAIEKAKAGYEVIGFDIQEQRVTMLNEGVNYIGDVIDEELAQLVINGQIKATTDYSLIATVDCVAICVPTPLDQYRQPDTSYVESSGRAIAHHLHEGMLVVLESTTYPGTTAELLLPILETSGLACGTDFHVAYSPERVDPGNKLYNTKNTPKVVGGITPACTNVASTLYRHVLDGEVCEVSSPAVAEMEKILENTFRNINIALANEMAILCHKMGINVWEVIDAAKTKPYGFMAFYPGPGIGGHCIPIDPFYLTWKARAYNHHTRLIETAGDINNGMADFIVQRCMSILNDEKKALHGSRILLLGAAYKKDIDDLRESPLLPILQKLHDAGATYHIVDPYVDNIACKWGKVKTEELSKELLLQSDLVLLLTDHSAFDYELIATYSPVLFDTRNAMQKWKSLLKKYVLL